MDTQHNKPEITITLGDMVPVLLMALGGIYVLAGGLCNAWVLQRFDADGQIAPQILENMSRARWILLAGGILLGGTGFLLYKKPLLQIKYPRFVLIGWGIVGLWVLAETVLYIRPLLTTDQLLAQSVSYEPAAYARNRLTDRAFDVLGPGGEVRFMLRDGYRSPGAVELKTGDEIRVVVVGGSFVFDPFAGGQGQDWPSQVQHLLHEAGFSRVRVINAGVPGHQTMDSIGRLLSEIHYLKPDYVILCHAWNDIKYFNRVSTRSTPLRFTRPLKEPSHGAYPSSWFRRTAERSQVFIRLRSLFNRTGRVVGPEGAVTATALADTVSALGIRQYDLGIRTFVDLTRNMAAVPILMTQPRLVQQGNTAAEKARIYYQYVGLNHEALIEAFEACDRIIRNVTEEKEALVLDLADALVENRDLFADHIHLNGSDSGRIVAEHITPFLVELIAEHHDK